MKNRNRQRLDYEMFEPRILLSANAGNLELTDVRQQEIVNYISHRAETNYLQQDGSELEYIGANQADGETTALFQQTYQGIPIFGAFVAVVDSGRGALQIVDRGYQQIAASGGDSATIGINAAQDIAIDSFDTRFDLGASADLTWYQSGSEMRLTWQVDTIAPIPLSDTVEFSTLVDAHTGTVLNQQVNADTAGDLLLNPETETGIYPRIVINNAIGAQGSRDYAAPFDAVAELSGCTGTLISPNVVLAARHCGSGPGTTVRFGDNSNNPVFTTTVQNRSLPDGNGSLLDGGDVEILTLSNSVPANVATPMRLIDATTSLVGMTAATIGFGFNGLGSVGHGFSADGFRWGGENIIDVYGTPADSNGSNIISTDFDNGTNGANTINGSSPTPLQFEATTAPGDSGGPVLVQVGNEWVIAGVLSGGTTNNSTFGDISWWTGTAIYRTQIEAAGGIFVGTGIGNVAFDANSYSDNDTISIQVADDNGINPLQVVLTSTSGDTEVLTLTDNGNSTYTNTITTSVGAASQNNGVLDVANGDTVTVTYIDPDDGMGGSQTATDTAVIDVVGPSDQLVGIDFDGGGQAPANWLQIGDGTTQTIQNLGDETGGTTQYDITITGDYQEFDAAVNANTVPQYSNSLGNIDNQIFTGSDPISLTYSDLTPGADYELYILGLETFFSDIRQRVTVQGAGGSITFDQFFGDGNLFINDQAGDSTRDLSEYALVVTADAQGVIDIDIDPLNGTEDVSLGGIAIQEIDTTFAGIVTADAVNVVRGVVVGGNASSIQDSDDVDFNIQPGFTINSDEPPAWIEVTGTSPELNPNQLELRIESSANTPNIEQIVSAFNYSTGVYDVVDTRNATFNTDGSFDVILSGNAGDYVNDADGEVKMQITWKPNGFIILFPWTASLDQAAWIVNDGAAPDRSNDANDGPALQNFVDASSAVTPSFASTFGSFSSTISLGGLSLTPTASPTLTASPITLNKVEAEKLSISDKVFEAAEASLTDWVEQIDTDIFKIRFDV